MASGASGTAKKRARFLDALREHGTVYAACQASGVPRTTVYRWREDDADFAAAWDAAIEDVTDMLEREAIRRATEGSDTLMIFLLKANRPEKYRETNNLQVKATHEHSGPNGAPIGIQFFDASVALTTIAGGSEADL